MQLLTKVRIFGNLNDYEIFFQKFIGKIFHLSPQLTHSLGLHTRSVAFFYRVEFVEVPFTASVPKPFAAAVGHVEVPANCEVTARAPVFLVATHLCNEDGR